MKTNLINQLTRSQRHVIVRRRKCVFEQSVAVMPFCDNTDTIDLSLPTSDTTTSFRLIDWSILHRLNLTVRSIGAQTHSAVGLRGSRWVATRRYLVSLHRLWRTCYRMGTHYPISFVTHSVTSGYDEHQLLSGDGLDWTVDQLAQSLSEMLYATWRMLCCSVTAGCTIANARY